MPLRHMTPRGYSVMPRQNRNTISHGFPDYLLLIKGDRAFARHNFVTSVTMPAFVSGIFRVRLFIFVLGALTAGIGWIGMYVGLSYFLGEEITKRIGKVGTRAVVGVIVIVIIGLCIRAGVSRWRNTRQGRSAEQSIS
jgi:hypothetical protein